ncbi:MAG: NAD-dependent deacylase [Bacteroidales bacterium]|nr:NAD-dependent deacylase [Bacteroidales bacterium]
MDPIQIQKAADVLRKSRNTIAFTGAGISVESGVPPFRGENGIWEKYDPKTLELGFFMNNPTASWKVIRELFYNYFGTAKSNNAHFVLAEMEKRGLLKCVITQNIDNLHQQAGSVVVHEFHGNSQNLVCLSCHRYFKPDDIDFDKLPPYCGDCGGLIKPDFIFFGEGIPMEAYQNSVEAAGRAEAVILVGSTGEVMPAAQMPYLAKQNGATIIEVNTEMSKFTNTITDHFIQGKAGEVLTELFFSLTGEELKTK